jgi:hypothetical protein
MPSSRTSTEDFDDQRTSEKVGSEYSPSVNAALGHFTEPITAAELAEKILRDHASYGSGRGGEVALRLKSLAAAKKEQKKSATDWVGQIAALFQRETVITGRCVLVGLAILDPRVGEELRAEGFLAVLMRETQDGYPSVAARLHPEALKRIENWFMVSGSTETLSDAPVKAVKDDQLGRAVFADVLAERIRRLRQYDSKSPLIVHVDGAWGSGKSTVLNFLEEALRREGWLVLRYNAWQQQRLDSSPWWGLTTLIAVDGARQVQWNAWLRLAIIRFRHFWFRTFAGRLPVLLAALAAIAVGVALYLTGAGPVTQLKDIKDTATVTQLKDIKDAATVTQLKDIKDILSVVAIVFGFVLAGSRFLAATDASAQEFLRSRPDPLGALVRHVERLLHYLLRPVAILVDDIDRCDSLAVVRLLEGIHTVFGTIPIAFVVAGDGHWVAQAFEKTYADAAPHGVDAFAKPLGTLFLEKIFQFSAVVPDMPKTFKSSFWRSLLKTQLTQARAGVIDQSAAEQVRNLHTEEDILKAVAAVDPREEPARAQAIREAAMRRLAHPDLIENASQHVLEVFEDAVEANPRAMKRQVMAYGMARASDLASFRNTPQMVLAAWSILCARWPAVADWLRENPDRVSQLDRGESVDAVPAAERPLLALMRRGEVRSLVSRLDADFLRRLTSQGSGNAI